MEFYKQPPKLRPIGLRPALLRIHSDLFLIHRRIESWRAYFPNQLTNLEKMVLVLEDRRFVSHSGIDWKSVFRETLRAATLRRHGGASTIDMQFVRTATGYRERTVKRKLYEFLLTYLMQYRYSKIVILRSYLSCAFFGSHLIGAERASKKLFSTSPDKLALEDAAFLAAMLVYPRPLSETPAWRARVQRRANYGMAIYVANKKRFDQFPG
jgi:membrane peptidoglycan carboxypeptidase